MDTVGKNTKRIQECIANQLQEDHQSDQISLNEYIDLFTGEPVHKDKRIIPEWEVSKESHRGQL